MTTQRARISLNVSGMDEAEMASTVAGIQKVAPASALMQNAAIAASFAALGKKATTLTSAAAAVAADQAQLKLDENARATAKVSVRGELDTLRALVVNTAADAADIHSMGFVPLSLAAQTRTVPPAPAEVVTRIGKVHGRAYATVQTSVKHAMYAAESTSDPIAPASVWSSLPGNGKRRILTGATGSKVWVRFAQVRFGLQGDWSTPVLVTLP